MICYLQETAKNIPNNSEMLLVVDSLLCSERFFSGFSSFPLSSKINISKFQFDWVQDLPENHFRVCGASWVNIINYYYYRGSSGFHCWPSSILCVHGWSGSPVKTSYIYLYADVHFCTNKITNKRECQCSSLSEQGP